MRNSALVRLAEAKFMDYASLVCSSEDCVAEVREVVEAYRELLEILGELRGYKLKLEHSRTPLIEGAEGELRSLLDEITSKLREKGLEVVEVRLKNTPGGGGLEDLLAMLVRRVFYEIVSDRVQGLNWVNGRCPVCGLKPLVGIVKREKGEIFSRDVLELRCVCGFTREYDMLECPSCRVRGRSNFEYMLLGRVTYRICRNCGHIIGLISDIPQADKDLLTITVLYGIPIVLNSISQDRD